MRKLNIPAKFNSIGVVCGLLLSIVTIGSAMAETTPWQETLGGKLRLISGGTQGSRIKAGLEIVLDKGWKTYWKVPGDSGIPPVLDPANSGNVAKLDIQWPVPSRIKVGSSHILGYNDAIIFPMLITPKDPDQPINLKLNALVGLCSDLCVPLSADLELVIPKGGGRDQMAELLIDRDLALVPLPHTDQFSITSLEHEKRPDKADRLKITALIPDGYGEKDLFVEGPKDWFLPLTSNLSQGADNQQKFELILAGLPKNGQSKGTKLIFTLTNGEDAVEQHITLEK